MDVGLSDLHQALQRPPKTTRLPGIRKAAVAAVLTGDLEFLLMRRAEIKGDPWSGHVSFPGGRVDPTDANPLFTAKRETMEELGLDLAKAEMLGELDPYSTPMGLPALVVHPFLFYLPALPPLQPSPAEVASTHLLGLDLLLSGKGRKKFKHGYRGLKFTFPCVDFEGQRLWGLTLRVIDDLLDRLDGRGKGMARIS
ncbi:MAG: CoA pyrophosphatase [Proteobacteria bacterium]|jgi:8-oxo-dGTP pyrophosphatase MutT (NUDIX family)|nr:CoA pyrophosphatase [Pseudomonadota bacterium]